MVDDKNNFTNLFDSGEDLFSSFNNDSDDSPISSLGDSLPNNTETGDNSVDASSLEDTVVNDLDQLEDSIELESLEDETVVNDLDQLEDSMELESLEDETVVNDLGQLDDSMVLNSSGQDVLENEVDDVSMKFDLPKNQSSVIKVIGVGGGGSNAVNYMIDQGIRGVDFMICNTDAQALDQGQALTKIQLGISLTEGLGAGANPSVGEKSAIESEVEIRNMLKKNTKMVFVTAGMGGGTGTGAAPVIARISKELDILTIGIITAPFNFEGPKRFKQAQDGIEKMRKYVDSLIVINNDKLIEVYGDLGLKAGFAKADEILMVAARSIAEVITQNCTVNIDLNDAKTVLKNSGTAIMGSGRANGPNRAEEVVLKALDSPLLNDNHIRGASKILLLILSGKNEITFNEIGEINAYLQSEAGNDADIILGVGEDPSLEEDISITIIATGVLGNGVDLATGLEAKKVHVLNSDETINDAQSIDKTEEILEDQPQEHDKVSADESINDNDRGSDNDRKKIILHQDLVLENLDDVSELNIKRAEERKKRLQKFHNLNFNNQVVLKELEEEPAYKRQGLELNDIDHSSIEPASGFVLDSEDDDVELKSNNSFLHDNVD